MSDFSERNRRRCESPTGFNHALDSWSMSDWMTATVGEVGEAANIIKKLNRGRDGIPGNSESEEELRGKLADEIADAAIYLDLLAQAAGMDLETIRDAKFAKTSTKIGYTDHRDGIPATPPELVSKARVRELISENGVLYARGRRMVDMEWIEQALAAETPVVPVCARVAESEFRRIALATFDKLNAIGNVLGLPAGTPHDEVASKAWGRIVRDVTTRPVDVAELVRQVREELRIPVCNEDFLMGFNNALGRILELAAKPREAVQKPAYGPRTEDGTGNTWSEMRSLAPTPPAAAEGESAGCPKCGAAFRGSGTYLGQPTQTHWTCETKRINGEIRQSKRCVELAAMAELQRTLAKVETERDGLRRNNAMMFNDCVYWKRGQTSLAHERNDLQEKVRSLESQLAAARAERMAWLTERARCYVADLSPAAKERFMLGLFLDFVDKNPAPPPVVTPPQSCYPRPSFMYPA